MGEEDQGGVVFIAASAIFVAGVGLNEAFTNNCEFTEFSVIHIVWPKPWKGGGGGGGGPLWEGCIGPHLHNRGMPEFCK